MKGRSLISLLDFSDAEIKSILDLSIELKAERAAGIRKQRFQGYNLALLFEKLSTRTRSSFATAFGEEGGNVVFLGQQEIHLGTKETVEDSARVFGRMFDIIGFRGYLQKTVEALAKYSGIPVINALTDEYHPTQALADVMTLQEQFGKLAGLKICYVGDGRNNVAHSLAIICAKLGIHFSCYSPKELLPPSKWFEQLAETASASGSILGAGDNIAQVEGADAVYTDVWVSMGEEDQKEKRHRLLRPFQVNSTLLKKTGKKNTIFLHCLPAIKDEEVSAEVFEGPNSLVWDQAENRKHTIKALLLTFLGLAGT